MSTTGGTVSVSKPKLPTIIMDEMVYQKIMHWVNKSNYEVSGLGKVMVDDSGNIRIVEAILLPQKNTATTTDIEAEDFGKAAFLMKDTPGELRLWWHSHVNMGVFWSGTDMNTIYALAQGGWMVNIVFNKKHETKTCLAVAMQAPEDFPLQGGRLPTLYDDQPLMIERSIPVDLLASWDKEYENKVTNSVPKFPASQGFQGRFPRFPHLATQFSQEEREALASMMDDEEPPRTVRIDEDDDSEAGWQARSRGSEHEKGDGTIQSVLARRDKLERAIGHMEDRITELENAKVHIPRKLSQALEKATLDLDEVEDELDQLVAAGMLSQQERVMLTMSDRHPNGE